MTNKFLLNLLGFNPDVTNRKSRHAIESIVSRLCLASLICLCMLTVGSGNVWGAEAAYKTAKFGSAATTCTNANSYSNSWTSTYSGFTVTVNNGNNSNCNWNHVRFGSKSAASTGTIVTGAIDKKVSIVSINLNAVNTTYTTSIKLYTSTNGSTWTESGSFSKSEGTQSVTIPTANRATGLYYKVEIVCSKSKNSVGNGFVQISQVDYKVETFTMSYNANGGTGSLSDANSPYFNGSTVTIKDNSFSRDGYTFDKWNTAADGSGTSYAAGATFTISANTTLYAQWKSSGTSVTLSKAATTNGSFTLSNNGPLNTATAQTITVTGTPNTGYYLSDVTQSGASSAPTITKTSATTYTIEYPQGCTGTSTITATFAASTWKFKYSGDSYTEHAMSESDGVASYSISLAADSRFNFCIDDNGTAYKNNGTIVTTTSGWVFNTSDGNCNIHTGPAGTYTFAINTTTKAVTVTYPTVTHPNEHYVYFKNSDVWGTVYGYLGNTGNDNKAAAWPGSVMQPTTTICGETYHYAALNAMSGTYNVIIFNNGGNGYGNQTSNLSTDGLGKFNANKDANWHDFMYSITFVDNGKTGGSMTNVSNICAGSNVTLAANGFTKTYFSFTGWKANVDVKIGGSTVTAGTLIADASTIQDIQSNITLTAQWTEKPKYTVTLDAGNGTIGTAGWTNTSGSVYTKTQDNGDASITLPTPTCNCSGWVFQGWKQGSAVNNQASFTPDKADGASFVPTGNVIYYAVYRQNATGGTTYNKITNTGDLTTGDYAIMAAYSTTYYAMGNSISGTYMAETSYSSATDSWTNSDAKYVWKIIKFGDKIVFYNANIEKYLTIVDGSWVLAAEGQLFTYSFNSTTKAWTFTSPSGKQLTYSSQFYVGDSQSKDIYLYKQGAGLTGNYYTNPTCSDLSITGIANPAAGGSVTLSATSAKSGEKVYAYYTADDDYNFTSWSISGTGSTLSSTSAQFTEITVGTANTTVTANFSAKDWKTVTWKANGDALTGSDLGSASVKVENGYDITAMPPTPTSCDGTSTTFIGWVAESDIWSGPTDDVSGITIYKKVSDFPTVTGNVVYHAVWAKKTGGSRNETLTCSAGTVVSDTMTFNTTNYTIIHKKNNSGVSMTAYSPWRVYEKNTVEISGSMTITGLDIVHSGTYYGVLQSNKGTLTLANSSGGTTTVRDIDATEVIITNKSGAAQSQWTSIKIYYDNSTYSQYLVKCCTNPELEFETYEQEVIREDLKGVKSTHKVIELPYTTSSSGTVTAEVKRMSTYGSRDESAAGYGCTTYTTITPDAENNKVVLEVWSVNDPATSGQWTYRVKVMQAATDALAGNYCAAEDYCFVDVVLRDKFVDQVNGNATINKDGKGTALNTPTEGDMDVDKNDDCHSTTRRLLGWIKETDLQTIYGTPRETGALDEASDYEANKSMVVAPGNSFTTSGVTWYAVWGEDNTPEP